ncbi:MAG: sulfurtransferase TusA family protein [Phycisphaerae bacterium]|nr:sulfurtransferase TusA family protein [Phycisphaerae bacterium]
MHVETQAVNLCGKVCPYPVVMIVREVDRLRSGESLRCLVDDPLAIKAVPEELEDYDDVSISITEHDRGWEITISRR